MGCRINHGVSAFYMQPCRELSYSLGAACSQHWVLTGCAFCTASHYTRLQVLVTTTCNCKGGQHAARFTATSKQQSYAVRPGRTGSMRTVCELQPAVCGEESRAGQRETTPRHLLGSAAIEVLTMQQQTFQACKWPAE